MANKHDVLRLLEQGLKPKEIAQRLGCLPEYVRATRRRSNPIHAAAEIRRIRERYWDEPEFRRKRIASVVKSRSAARSRAEATR